MRMTEKTPTRFLTQWWHSIKKEYKTAFVAAFVMGLLIHMPVLVSDIPNHDGLGSMYFDQNMITSGRWFLTVACGFSSYFTIPWVIGLLGLLFLALAAAALTALLELRDTLTIILVSGLLVSFPALASTFAYVFTMDGYMLALLLAVLSVLCTKKWKSGFWPGAVCLAFSMGTYQAYLPFAILLCIYEVLMIFMDEGLLKPGKSDRRASEKVGGVSKEKPDRKSDGKSDSSGAQGMSYMFRMLKMKLKMALHYLYMGVLGVILYYVLLRILLLIQGKELASYQGISGMEGGGSGLGLASVAHMYRDFLSFTVKGNVLFHGVYSLGAILVLGAVTIFVVFRLVLKRKWWKSLGFFVIIALAAVLIPPATNVILLISPDVTYHLLMRYQWVLYLILPVAFVSRFSGEDSKGILMQWGMLAAAFVIVFHYGVTDNIGYSNLQKRYEKTYAYCVRLLDRIEQTEGYYQGIPIAMVGVVGYNPFPETDITMSVTSNMIGLNGDTLLYTGENYQVFIQNYLGATLNIMSPEEMGDIYFSPEYIEMESFPAASSVKIVDGVMYVKTENVGRD